jgi:hypothetical protein
VNEVVAGAGIPSQIVGEMVLMRALTRAR